MMAIDAALVESERQQLQQAATRLAVAREQLKEVEAAFCRQAGRVEMLEQLAARGGGAE